MVGLGMARRRQHSEKPLRVRRETVFLKATVQLPQGMEQFAAMPAARRTRAEAAFQGRNLTTFRDTMLSWMRGSGMTPATFGDRFFGRAADDSIVNLLHDAAKLALTSTTPGDMAAASGKVAEAMQKIGLDRWSRFMADAQARAQDPATEAAIRASIKAPDAITPVHPENYLIGIRGAAGLLRAGVQAALRQASSGSQPAVGGPVASSAEKPGNTAGSNASRPLNAGEPPAASARASSDTEPAAPGSPAAQSAASVRDKLERYTLNLEHRRGGSKARWFQQALGFTRENSEELARQLVFDEKSAVQTGVTEFGVKYNQTINVVGANGRTIPVITAWLRGTDGVVKLVTALPGN